jgi:hypothetical protein
MNLDVNPSIVTNFRREQCEFWSTIYDQTFE